MSASDVVVVGVDGSVESLEAVAWAAREASRRQARLRVINAWHPHVYPSSPLLIAPIPEVIFEPEQTAHEHVMQACGVAREVIPDLDVEVRTPAGPSALTLLENSVDAQLLVIGATQRSTVDRAVFGSVTTHAVTHAHCPVVSVHGRSPFAERSSQPLVVLGFDYSTQARSAASFAFEYAQGNGLDVAVVEAVSLIPGTSWDAGDEVLAFHRKCLQEATATFAAQYPMVTTSVSTALGQPASVLIEHARNADLLVVGSRGRGWFQGMLLGSVSAALAHHTSVTLAVVHDSGL